MAAVGGPRRGGIAGHHLCGCQGFNMAAVGGPRRPMNPANPALIDTLQHGRGRGTAEGVSRRRRMSRCTCFNMAAVGGPRRAATVMEVDPIGRLQHGRGRGTAEDGRGSRRGVLRLLLQHGRGRGTAEEDLAQDRHEAGQASTWPRSGDRGGRPAGRRGQGGARLQHGRGRGTAEAPPRPPRPPARAGFNMAAVGGPRRDGAEVFEAEHGGASTWPRSGDRGGRGFPSAVASGLKLQHGRGRGTAEGKATPVPKPLPA